MIWVISFDQSEKTNDDNRRKNNPKLAQIVIFTQYIQYS